MNTGNRGKFSERIKKIAFDKRNGKKYAIDKNGSFKRILLFPLMLLDKKIHEEKVSTNKDTSYNNDVSFKDDNVSYISPKKRVFLNNNDFNRQINIKKNNDMLSAKKIVREYKSITANKEKISSANKGINLKKDKPINIFGTSVIVNKAINKKKEDVNRSILVNGYNKNNDNEILSKKNINLDKEKLYTEKNILKQEKLDILSGKIITDISKYLVKNINTLEIVESDLYVLSKFDGNKESLDKCREYIIKLKALQNKLDKIRKDFNILKENVDFDNLLDISDGILLDKLIEFRNSVDKDIALSTAKNYKLLEEYKYLYARIDKVVNETNKLEVEIINRKDDLEQAGINFTDFQNKVYAIDKIETTTEKMLQKQDDILANLSSKVSDISVTKKIERIYKGFGALLFNSLKLYGLYMLTPFKNSIPGIAMATAVTKKTVDNLLKAAHVEEKTKYIYHVEDYRSILNSSMNDLSELDRIMTNSLSDIKRVKNEFINKFSSYSSQLPKYSSTLRKLNQMEKQTINNQLKVRLLSERALVKKRENEKALVKVKNLNNN